MPLVNTVLCTGLSCLLEGGLGANRTGEESTQWAHGSSAPEGDPRWEIQTEGTESIAWNPPAP